MRPASSSSSNSFGARSSLQVGGRGVALYRLDALAGRFEVASLPYSLKVLLENLLRHEDGVSVTADDVTAVAGWRGATAQPDEIAFFPARILMQDFTGVPAMVDLAAMRDAMAELGGSPRGVNPLVPVDLVIDHSIVADVHGRPDAFLRNAELEFERNRERYALLRWAQESFHGLRVVPPNTGICHQVNLEYLARVVHERDGVAFPDTLVGTDSHTPMVNGLGVLGWGVGGIEAEAAALGQPISMLVPPVLGFKLTGELPEGSTATDLVLTVTEMLRRHGVVGKFVEFYGPGVGRVPLENRATIGNMSPEYGSTVTIFPIDGETLRYLRMTGRPDDSVRLVEAYAKEQGLWHDETAEPVYSETLELDLSTVLPCLAGPKRPQDRIPLADARPSFRAALNEYLEQAGLGARPGRRRGDPPVPEGAPDCPDVGSALSFPASDPPATTAGGGACHAAAESGRRGPSSAGATEKRTDPVPIRLADGTECALDHGHVVIAAITSCTNTSNPSVMLAAGLLAKNAVERGLAAKPWVKTSLAPGSKVVMAYYERAGLLPYLEKLGFHLVGYGCTTCIGNSGPLATEISAAVAEAGLSVCSVLSGNRNFEGRIHPDCRMNYLASPPLVVAYALAGTMDFDPYREPLGTDAAGRPVFLRDVWPSSDDVSRAVEGFVDPEMFARSYASVFEGDASWRALASAAGERFAWSEASTYVRRPPFLEGLPPEPPPLADVRGARALAWLGDSVTTDHISPAGVIQRDSPAGRWLVEHGVEPRDFNSYGARRGNHEVMIRGTFANPRIRNRLLPGVEGPFTAHLPGGEQMTIYDASVRYAAEGVPLIVLAGREYGSGSSRDWAAKGTVLLGVRAVLAEGFERIHRSNLIGMGVLPLQFAAGESAGSLGLTGRERFDVEGIAGTAAIPPVLTVRADGRAFEVRVRIDTATEAEYFRHGGILPFVLRQLGRGGPA